MAALGNFLANMLLGGLNEGQRRREKAEEIQGKIVEKAIEEKIKQGDPYQVLQQFALLKTLHPEWDFSKIKIGPRGQLSMDFTAPKGKKPLPTSVGKDFERLDQEIAKYATPPMGFSAGVNALFPSMDEPRKKWLNQLLTHRDSLVRGYQEEFEVPKEFEVSPFDPRRVATPSPEMEDPLIQEAKKLAPHLGYELVK